MEYLYILAGGCGTTKYNLKFLSENKCSLEVYNNWMGRIGDKYKYLFFGTYNKKGNYYYILLQKYTNLYEEVQIEKDFIQLYSLEFIVLDSIVPFNEGSNEYQFCTAANGPIVNKDLEFDSIIICNVIQQCIIKENEFDVMQHKIFKNMDKCKFIKV
jgi:hypothetical protein